MSGVIPSLPLYAFTARTGKSLCLKNMRILGHNEGAVHRFLKIVYAPCALCSACMTTHKPTVWSSDAKCIVCTILKTLVPNRQKQQTHKNFKFKLLKTNASTRFNKTCKHTSNTQTQTAASQKPNKQQPDLESTRNYTPYISYDGTPRCRQLSLHYCLAINVLCSLWMRYRIVMREMNERIMRNGSHSYFWTTYYCLVCSMFRP